mmetsp:Transcript_30332/g.93890  ORF Transcript_30332/g.93890 Transcript_30332/m.93890 type:complete len:208 (+) Transcript_30332:198-821(+)
MGEDGASNICGLSALAEAAKSIQKVDERDARGARDASWSPSSPEGLTAPSRKRESAPVVKREAKKVKREAQLSDAGKFGGRLCFGRLQISNAVGGSPRHAPFVKSASKYLRPARTSSGEHARRRGRSRGGRVAPRHRRGAVADASRRRRRDPRTQVPRQEDLQDRRPRLGAVRLPRGDADEPRRRRGRDADIPWETSRGHAAAVTRT